MLNSSAERPKVCPYADGRTLRSFPYGSLVEIIYRKYTSGAYRRSRVRVLGLIPTKQPENPQVLVNAINDAGLPNQGWRVSGRTGAIEISQE